MSATTTHVTPERIMSHTFAFIGTQALSAAVDLDLFTHIHQGATSMEALQKATGASERGLRRLVGALKALGFLTPSMGLAPDTEKFLVKGTPAYLGGLVNHQKSMWSGWGSFADVIRQGQPPYPPVESDEDDGAFFATFVDALFNLNFLAAQAVAGELGTHPRAALDVGAGSGVWSLALAQALPELKVTAVDRQQVIDKVTRPFAERMGVADRYSFKGGSFREVDLGQEAYDVAYLGHILHSEGPAHSHTLLRRLHQALRPQGVLVVAEMVADEQHGEHVFPQLFGLNMVMHTAEGDVWSASELEQMCTRAGFSQVRWFQAPSPSPMLLAIR